MFNTKLFFIIFLLFILFCSIQIYLYYRKYINNKKQIDKIESFENILLDISKKDYLLDDLSLQKLLDDFENFT